MVLPLLIIGGVALVGVLAFGSSTGGAFHEIIGRRVNPSVWKARDLEKEQESERLKDQGAIGNSWEWLFGRPSQNGDSGRDAKPSTQGTQSQNIQQAVVTLNTKNKWGRTRYG